MIYLCIPAHNEEQTVGVVLWKIRQVMAELQRDYQLLVADDASTDRSQDVLEPYTRVLPLTVLRNAERRGYAASLEMLLREAVSRSDYPRRDVIITLQADFTDEPGHVGTLVKRIESGADIVASNMLPLQNGPRLARWRRPLLNALVRRLGWPDEVRDPLNGFHAFRVFCVSHALEQAKDERLLRHEGWAANAELLRQAAPHARRVDVVEQKPHPERLQRTSRFQLMPALRQVMSLRQGRAPHPALAVSELRPASVMGGPSSQRSLLAESMRNGVQQVDERPRPQARRSRNGGQRSQRAAASAGRSGERTRKTQRGEAAPERAEGRAGREPKRPRPRSGPPRPDADAAAGAPAELAGETSAPKKRARRGRRGGSGRPRSETRETGAPPAPEVAVAPSESLPVSSGDADDAVATEAQSAAAEEGGAPRRRRSNRRGGRGRRRRSPGEASAAGQDGAADAPPQGTDTESTPQPGAS